jgi:signal transduction histidine kinase
MFVVAAALLGLIALLATLQYKWLGRISDEEREGMKASLNTRASAFAQDLDSELTRAYLLFQVEPMEDAGNLAARVAARYDRWQGTARHPRLIKDVYLTSGSAGQALQRFNPGTRFLEPADWPDSMRELRAQLRPAGDPSAPIGSLLLRTMMPAVWEHVPAVVVPTHFDVFYARETLTERNRAAPLDNRHGDTTEFNAIPALSFTVLLLDRDYLVGEMLPGLAQQHFRRTGDAFDYQVAVVSSAGRGVVYHSAAGFSPAPDAQADAAVDLLQVRTQDFGNVAAEVRRFATMFTARLPPDGRRGTSPQVLRKQIILPPMPGDGAVAGTLAARGSGSVSIIVQQNAPSDGRAGGPATWRMTPPSASRWRLIVKHPSGSLEGAVNAVRRRNLIISSSILAVLGASVGLLILSTRRAQDLARQQMEFVAAVSHELRTPLAVIRSAGDNLADGVVRDDEQIRKYGDLVRNEGRRLTEMVEQILEFAGIQSGQRGFALRPVPIAPILHDIVESSRALIDAAGMQVEYDIPEALPPVLGDEPALRRVFQNLIANAIKYGAAGGPAGNEGIGARAEGPVPSERRHGRVEGWIGLRARHSGREVHVTVADRGIGIAPAEQPRIFEPFYRTPEVIAAQTQGAGLGLSLVKRIVEAHGGRVVLRSAPGAGSEFIVALPVAADEPLDSPVPPLARDRPLDSLAPPLARDRPAGQPAVNRPLDSPVAPLARDRPLDSPVPPLARDRPQGRGSHA